MSSGECRFLHCEMVKDTVFVVWSMSPCREALQWGGGGGCCRGLHLASTQNRLPPLIRSLLIFDSNCKVAAILPIASIPSPTRMTCWPLRAPKAAIIISPGDREVEHVPADDRGRSLYVVYACAVSGGVSMDLVRAVLLGDRRGPGGGLPSPCETRSCPWSIFPHTSSVCVDKFANKSVITEEGSPFPPPS